MHPAAREWCEKYCPRDARSVVEVGSFDVNGGVRDLFPNATVYLGIDLKPGRGVDLVMDAAEWVPDRLYDCAVSTETFEHTPKWRQILRRMKDALSPGGVLVMTCATTGRNPHSCLGFPVVPPDEFYGNVTEEEFRKALVPGEWQVVNVNVLGTDLRAHLVKA